MGEQVMIEERKTNSNTMELLQRVKDTHIFLKTIAIKLRQMSENDPDISQELRYMAQQLENEAADLTFCGAD